MNTFVFCPYIDSHCCFLSLCDFRKITEVFGICLRWTFCLLPAPWQFPKEFPTPPEMGHHRLKGARKHSRKSNIWTLKDGWLSKLGISFFPKVFFIPIFGCNMFSFRRVLGTIFLHFLPKIWKFPKIVVPPKHPKMTIFSMKTHGCWVPPF